MIVLGNALSANKQWLSKRINTSIIVSSSGGSNLLVELLLKLPNPTSVLFQITLFQIELLATVDAISWEGGVVETSVYKVQKLPSVTDLANHQASETVFKEIKDYYIIGRANPIACAVGHR